MAIEGRQSSNQSGKSPIGPADPVTDTNIKGKFWYYFKEKKPLVHTISSNVAFHHRKSGRWSGKP